MHSWPLLVRPTPLVVVAVAVTALAVAAVAVVLVRAAPSGGEPPATPAQPVGPAGADPSCRGVTVTAGSDAAAVVGRAPEGATICFSAGVHRLTAPLVPKQGQRLVGAPGAVLSGARPITRWTRAGEDWRADGYLPAESVAHGECAPEHAGCGLAEMVFVDSAPLRRVLTAADLAPGRFYADYATNTIWLRDPPRGRTVEVARAPAAIAGTAGEVTVAGLRIEKFANPAQAGAVEGDGPRWVISGNDVRLNHGHGIHSDSRGGRITGNHLHDNGQLGLGGDGSDTVVAGNEIDHNNTAGFSSEWEAGGLKWGYSERLTVQGNRVHDNAGPGIWTDINNVDVTVEGNDVRDNAGHGIFHEIGYRAVIRDNRVVGNGWSDPMPGWGGCGIRIAASPDVEVAGNVVSGNANGVVLVQQDRRDSPSPRGPHELRDVRVHGNVVTMAHGLTGLVDDTGDRRVYERAIRFFANDYRLDPPAGAFFTWQDAEWDSTSWTRRFGQDRASTFRGA